MCSCVYATAVAVVSSNRQGRLSPLNTLEQVAPLLSLPSLLLLSLSLPLEVGPLIAAKGSGGAL